MKTAKESSYLIIGLALFSMFFGSGNLIFPLYVGQLSSGNLIAGIIGFALTAVFVPFLGVVAMVVYKGDYDKFFSCLGKWAGPLMIALLLTVWIPLGSGPRCATLAYASLLPYFNMPPMWAFSLAYCLLIMLVVYKRSRMLDILGYVLTPLLLTCLGLIFFKGTNFSGVVEIDFNEKLNLYWIGLKEGYNTMDLIASFFFTASIYGILKESSPKGSNPLKITFKSCVVGVFLLGLVYIGLITVAAVQASNLEGIPKDQLLSQIAKSVLGPQMGVVAALAICLACFTTSVALVVVYSEYLVKSVFKNPNKMREATKLTLVICFVMSLFGLEGITFVTAPILQIFYPTLIVLIIWNVGGRIVKTYFLAKDDNNDNILSEPAKELTK